jgi:Polyketide cyclase / dehydrase and lipid transport
VTRYRTTVSSKWDLDRTFYYVSDLSHCSQWNPDVTSSLQISAGEVGLGTKFDLIANINGRPLPLHYEVTVFEPLRRVVLHARSRVVRSIDEVTFSATPQGTDVTYETDLRTLGRFRLAAPFVGMVLRGAGERARAGLLRELNV